MPGIEIQIKQDVRDVERMLKGLGRTADKVITRALNRTIKPVESAAVKSLSKDMRLTQKVVRKSFHINRANFATRKAQINVFGKRVPLIDYGARQTKKGVTYKAPKGGRGLVAGGFLSTMRSGHKGVFKRAGKGRLPIQQLYGPSVPYVFLKRHIQRAMDSVAKERWDKEVRTAMKYYVSKL